MDLSALKRLDQRATRGLRRLLEPRLAAPAEAAGAAAAAPGPQPAQPARPAQRVTAIVARSADSLVLVPLFAALAWLEGFTRRGLAFPLGLAFVLSVLLTAVLKFSFRRRRPRGQWGRSYRRLDPHSFPSGHASRTAALAVTAWVVQGWPLGLPLLVWSVLVSLARVVLGVHYTLDIVVGYLLGLAIGLGLGVLWIEGFLF
jgi:undecaprenyl-diphosphatase